MVKIPTDCWVDDVTLNPKAKGFRANPGGIRFFNLFSFFSHGVVSINRGSMGDVKINPIWP